MKTVEEMKEIFKDEGFRFIYEWKDEPNTVYEEHAHKGKTSLYIVSGEVVFLTGIEKTVKAGERFDVPVGVKHTAKVGAEGCVYVVGEEFEDNEI
jgi:quercetin dioxygenase-like cupin family protein